MNNTKVIGKTKGKWDVEHTYEELELHVVVKVKKTNNFVVDYEVRALTLYDDGNGPAFKFIDNESLDPTRDFDRAEIIVKGSIKWDGCSHNDFGEKGYIHGCSRRDLTRLSTLFERLFDIATELLGHKENLN